jgi:serine/threonine protein phosphatase PrpC
MLNAHHAILDYTDPASPGDTPRTTCVACIVQDNIAYWVHAGDSRLYLMRNGKGQAQTRDHSRVSANCIEEGVISEAQLPGTRTATRSTAAWAARTPPEIEFRARHRSITATSWLLCTDGLWGVLLRRHDGSP